MKLRKRTTGGRDLTLGSAIARVNSAAASLHRARVSPARLADVRRDFLVAEASTDAAIEVALAAGAGQAPVLRQLRDRRELLLLAGLSTPGVDLPDCAQPASLAADGPLLAGLTFEWEAPVPGHAHGLDLAVALEPDTRAAAGAPGPHLPSVRLGHPHPHPEGPAVPRSRTPQSSTVTRTIVYGDFSDVSCYVASLLADALVGTDAAVDWRAVQHRPQLAFSGLRLDTAAQQGLADELLSIGPLLDPDLVAGCRPRTFLPNTQAAVAGYAEAHEAGVGDEVRRILFAAYWTDGADIGNPEVLRRLLAEPLRRGTSTAQPVARSGYAVTLAHGPVTSGADRRIQAWNRGWHAPAVRHGSQLVVVDRAGCVFVGREALLELAAAERAASGSPPARLAAGAN